MMIVLISLLVSAAHGVRVSSGQQGCYLFNIHQALLSKRYRAISRKGSAPDENTLMASIAPVIQVACFLPGAFHAEQAGIGHLLLSPV